MRLWGEAEIGLRSSLKCSLCLLISEKPLPLNQRSPILVHIRITWKAVQNRVLDIELLLGRPENLHF